MLLRSLIFPHERHSFVVPEILLVGTVYVLEFSTLVFKEKIYHVD